MFRLGFLFGVLSGLSDFAFLLYGRGSHNALPWELLGSGLHWDFLASILYYRFFRVIVS